MKYFFKYIIMAMVWFSIIPCAMAIERPEVVLKSVTDQMLSALKEERGVIEQNPDRLVVIVNDILVPHADIYDMSRWVVGRQAWMKATAEQKSEFSKEFKNLLIRTYASNLTAYTNQTIEYLPVKDDALNKSRVQIATLIKSSDREPIRVSYRLKNAGGKWMLYDINIEGVSLLQGFKAQFEPQIQASGMNSVIEKIKMHNEKPL